MAVHPRRVGMAALGSEPRLAADLRHPCSKRPSAGALVPVWVWEWAVAGFMFLIGLGWLGLAYWNEFGGSPELAFVAVLVVSYASLIALFRD